MNDEFTKLEEIRKKLADLPENKKIPDPPDEEFWHPLFKVRQSEQRQHPQTFGDPGKSTLCHICELFRRR